MRVPVLLALVSILTWSCGSHCGHLHSSLESQFEWAVNHRDCPCLRITLDSVPNKIALFAQPNIRRLVFSQADECATNTLLGHGMNFMDGLDSSAIYSGLNLACRYGNMSIVQVLLTEVEDRTSYQSPYQDLLIGAAPNRIAILNLLHKHNWPTVSSGYNAIIHSVKLHDIKALNAFLEHERRLVDLTDENGWTALHHSVSSECDDCFDLLREAGANLNSLTKTSVLRETTGDWIEIPAGTSPLELCALLNATGMKYCSEHSK